MTEPRPPARPALCAICRKRPVVPEYRPFCSRRCADVDLARWLGGVYRVEDDTEIPSSPFPSPIDEIDEK